MAQVVSKLPPYDVTLRVAYVYGKGTNICTFLVEIQRSRNESQDRSRQRGVLQVLVQVPSALRKFHPLIRVPRAK